MVTRGFLQAFDIDYQKIFSPLPKSTTIRVVLTLEVSKGRTLRQMDINNSFLQGDLMKNVFMFHPSGFESNNVSLVIKLNKAFYGSNKPLRLGTRSYAPICLVWVFKALKLIVYFPKSI